MLSVSPCPLRQPQQTMEDLLCQVKLEWDVPLGEDYESWSNLMKEFFLMAIIDGIKEDYETLICVLWLIHKIPTCKMVWRDLKLKF